MSEQATAQLANAAVLSPPVESLLQRTCACGQHTIGGAPCSSCKTSNEKPFSQSLGNERKEVLPSIRRGLRSRDEPMGESTRTFFQQRAGRDFSRVPVHTDGKAAAGVGGPAYTMVKQDRMSALALQRKVDNDKDEPPDAPAQATPEDPLSGTPPAEPMKNPPPAPSCVRKSLANSVTGDNKRLGGQKVEASLGAREFGNTSKLGADFKFGACKIGSTWRFHLDGLAIPIASKVQPVDFRKNIPTAADPEVTKTSYPTIVSDLSPTSSVTFAVTCGVTRANDAVSTYSTRDTYWNHQFVIDHEGFHVTDWVDMYKKELVKSENEVQAHSIPESEAKDAASAVAKADSQLTNFMASAYGRVCAAFVPKKESRAYDKGAPAYQKLVDEIKKRAVDEKW